MSRSKPGIIKDPGCQNRPISASNFKAMKSLIAREDISLVVIGPEVPLESLPVYSGETTLFGILETRLF